MTNLFKRINDMISANINDLIDRVEDPERMVKQIIREMEDNISKAKEGLISKELQPAPSYWHGCQYPVTWMWIPRA